MRKFVVKGIYIYICISKTTVTICEDTDEWPKLDERGGTRKPAKKQNNKKKPKNEPLMRVVSAVPLAPVARVAAGNSRFLMNSVCERSGRVAAATVRAVRVFNVAT